MSDPSLALQQALVPVLLADLDLKDLIGGRIYDPVPDRPTFPYLTWGDDLVISDAIDDCIDGAETTITLHVWSRQPGWVETKQIAATVLAAIGQLGMTEIEGHMIVDINHESSHYLSDPDGLTRHAVITFNVLSDAI